MNKRRYSLLALLLALVTVLMAYPVLADDGVDKATFVVDGRTVATSVIQDGSVTMAVA